MSEDPRTKYWSGGGWTHYQPEPDMTLDEVVYLWLNGERFHPSKHIESPPSYTSSGWDGVILRRLPDPVVYYYEDHVCVSLGSDGSARSYWRGRAIAIAATVALEAGIEPIGDEELERRIEKRLEYSKRWRDELNG